MWSRLSRRGRKRQQGQVVILLAFSAVALIVIAGLALDVGRGFVDQRSLQGGADSASDAGARMVSADFHACLNGLTSPYSDTTISDVVGQTFGKAAAAQRGTVFNTASYVNGNGSAIGTVGSDSAGLTCTPGSPPTWSGAYGVYVHGTEGHATMVLQLIGDKTGSEAASATSIFGVLAYGSPSLFTVWDLYCDGNSTGPPLAITNPPESITYRDNQWSGSNCDQNVNGKNGLKGDLRAFTPDPFAVPGWVHTQPGNGTYTPVPDNVIILLPMMAPCPTTAACVALDGSQQSVGTAYFNTGDNEEMYMSGLIAVQTTDACGGGPTSIPCTGNVVAYFTDQQGVLVCPTQQQPGCQNAPTTNPAATTVVELLH